MALLAAHVHGAVGHLVGGHDPRLDILLAQLVLYGERQCILPKLSRAGGCGGARRREQRRARSQHCNVKPGRVGVRLTKQGAGDAVAVGAGGGGVGSAAADPRPRADQAAVALELGKVDYINLQGD